VQLPRLSAAPDRGVPFDRRPHRAEPRAADRSRRAGPPADRACRRERALRPHREAPPDSSLHCARGPLGMNENADGAHELHELLRARSAVERLIRDGRRGALVTLVSARGSTYRRPGARVVLSEEGGAVAGLVSGGCLERDLLARLEGWAWAPEPRLVAYDERASETVFGLGSGCGGAVELLVEPFDAAHPPQLLQGP